MEKTDFLKQLSFFFSENAGPAVQITSLAALREFEFGGDVPVEEPTNLVIAPANRDEFATFADVFKNVIAKKFGNRFFRVFFIIPNFNEFDLSSFNSVIPSFVNGGGRFDFGFAFGHGTSSQ